MKKEDYYKALAEVRVMEFENYSVYVEHLMIAKGIIVEMESDLLKFLKNNEPTVKSKEQQERINMLGNAVEHFMKISEINMQLREMFIINEKWMTGLKQENAELKQKLSDLEYFNTKGGNNANGSGT